jgi:hypothetical protein
MPIDDSRLPQKTAGWKPAKLIAALVVVLAAILPAPSAAAAAEPCPNEQLRAEQPYGLRLPDCRAYELVSPLNKNGSDIVATDARASVSDESPAITYTSPGSFAEPKGAVVENRYISQRGKDGWSTEDINPVYKSFGSGNSSPPFYELFFTPELIKGVVRSPFTPLIEGEEPGYVNFYVADIGSDAYQLVTTIHPSGEEPQYDGDDLIPPYGAAPAGVSTDLSHVVFQQSASLCCGASKSRDHIYEWVNGGLSQVDVPPPGGKFERGDVVGAGQNGDVPEDGNVWHAVSEDGLRVFFTAPEGTQSAPSGSEQLYVRMNPEQPPVGGSECAVTGDACTVEVSASQRTNAEGKPEPDPHGPQTAKYEDASADGSKVFFTSTAELTNDADTGPEDNAANLYEYNVETGALTDLTVVTEAEKAEDAVGAAVLGLVTAGEDGSYVYFVAEGRLTAQANAGGEVPEVGKPNLYLSHDGRVTFIAQLARPKLKVSQVPYSGDETDWWDPHLDEQAGPGWHTVRVTPDGTHLAFQSMRSLTGYDNEQAAPGECEEEAFNEFGDCREVYLYDAETEKLVCASCAPSGARPVGPAELGGHEQTRDSFGGVAPFYLPQNLSADGRRLFFQTPDALVPQDSNGLPDVYEWEEAGEGSCTRAEGCVFPVSNVAGGNESLFMDATPDGEDVYIATQDQLMPAADSDTSVNVYDARVGGGFPVSVAPPACDNADSCKPPVAAQPAVFGVPTSATFSGPGDTAPATAPPAVKPKSTVKKAARCTKPKHLERDRCVKKAKAKKKTKHTRAGDKRRGS